MRGGCVAQHPFGHQLGKAVGRFRRQPRVLAHRLAAGRAIDRRGRGEDEMRHSARDRRLDQRAGLDGVVLVVAERIGDRFRNHDRTGEMDDRVDRVLAYSANPTSSLSPTSPTTSCASGAPPSRSRSTAGRARPTSSPCIEQFPDHVAADIAGAASYKYGHSSLKSPLDIGNATVGNAVREHVQHRRKFVSRSIQCLMEYPRSGPWIIVADHAPRRACGVAF